MKNLLPLSLIALFCTVLSSCELVGDIFEAGIWTGVIIVVIVIALVIWLVSKVFGGRR